MTLYRINRKNNTVSFVWSVKKNELLTASEKEEIYTFDEILSQLEDFRNNRMIIFENMKIQMMNFLNVRVKSIDLAKSLKKSVLENKNNIFFKYYANILTNIYMKVGEPIFMPEDYVMEKLRHKKLVEQAQKKLQNSFNEILNIMNDERNFDYKTAGEILVAVPNSQLAVIRTETQNIVYRVADRLLVTFFYEFSNTIFEKEFKVCECHFCHKHFLGTEKTVCCQNAECISEQKKLKNQNNREKRKSSPYIHEVDNYNTYVRNRKKELKTAKISPYVMDEFEDLQEKNKKTVHFDFVNNS